MRLISTIILLATTSLSISSEITKEEFSQRTEKAKKIKAASTRDLISHDHDLTTPLSTPRPIKDSRDTDFQSFLRKINQKGYVITNNTNKSVVLVVEGKEGKVVLNNRLTLEPGDSYELNPKITIDTMRVSKSSSSVFANLVEANGRFSVSLDPTQDIVFPRPLRPYSLIPKLLPKNPPIHPQYPPSSELSDKFIEDYNIQWNNTKWWILPQEKLQMDRSYGLMDDLSHRTDLNTLFFNSSKPKSQAAKIPLITHTIWLTNESAPKPVSQDYLNWMIRSIDANPVDQGWTHYLWLNTKQGLPCSETALNRLGIHVRYIQDDPNIPLKSTALDEIKAGRFGRASDILRQGILWELGGIYKDTDYVMYQSYALFNCLYNYYSALEPQSAWVGNAFIAAAPKHPITGEFLRRVACNYDPRYTRPYIRDMKGDEFYKTIVLTGPVGYTVAQFRILELLSIDTDALMAIFNAKVPNLKILDDTIKILSNLTDGLGQPAGLGQTVGPLTNYLSLLGMLRTLQGIKEDWKTPSKMHIIKKWMETVVAELNNIKNACGTVTVFTPELLYPTSGTSLPSDQIVKAGDPIPAAAAGWHAWHGGWTQRAGGNG